ncbi:peptide-methionine (S)-S-oxide reductase MsrA [Neolewinella aurantiaca]|uniref:peptide-methionine (S)-S-oxide reductase n=1 Tax=Neolewinella aurantiaca TaxID=2602767 RepID=A0A5C7FWA9_9BACT|nr:peptide-methionine (S)-S-oxide reductase MsrA [Neolewinella aurantiaca]TXF89921.1 peptide-methionine (S)-S-oxide reductase MsrA [Neolewinella aurantiaca]
MYLASGCFWGREFHFRQLNGVLSTRTGFMGGVLPNPTYEQVCTDKTGHAETVEVVYDIRKLTTRQLLTEFFLLHDFTRDRSGQGGQYRSVIFIPAAGPQAPEQHETAADIISLLNANGYPPATKVQTGCRFYAAANRHQQYCSAKGIHPKKRENEEVSEILTF